MDKFPSIYRIERSIEADTDEIFRMYGWATSVQRLEGAVLWPEFKRGLIKKEIEEGRQWKLIIDNKIACIWATTFNDPFIWREKDEDPALYLHRIATRPTFRGNKLVSKIVEWAVQFAETHHKIFIRLDTVGKNEKLVAHYQNCGFTYLGLSQLGYKAQLPAHYHHAKVNLFQIDLRKRTRCREEGMLADLD